MTENESTATLISISLAHSRIWNDAAVRLGMPRFRRHDMLVSGHGNAAAQYWWTRAIPWRRPPRSDVRTADVWAILLGFAIWGDIPTAGLAIGSAIVIASGLYLFWRESRRIPVEEPDA